MSDYGFICTDNETQYLSFIETTSLIIGIVGLFIIIIVEYIAIANMNSSPDLIKTLTYLMYTTTISSVLALLFYTLMTIFCMYPISDNITFYFSAFGNLCYNILLLTLLGTLLFRLKLSYKETIFALSKTSSDIFNIFYIIICINGMINIIIYSLRIYSPNEINPIPNLLLISNQLMYIICTISGLYIFAKKLIIVAKSLNDHDTDSAMINTASKNISLLSLAIFSSFSVPIPYVVRAFLPQTDVITKLCYQIALLLCKIDIIINVLCLILQYKFASKYYIKYCKYLEYPIHRICLSKYTKDVSKKLDKKKKNLHDKRIEIKQNTI